MCKQLKFSDRIIVPGSMVQLECGARQWMGVARMETLDEKFPQWRWKGGLISADGFMDMVYEEGTPPTSTNVALTPPDKVLCVYDRYSFRVVTRASTRDEKLLLGKDRVPMCHDRDGKTLYFHKRHTYKRIDWR